MIILFENFSKQYRKVDIVELVKNIIKYKDKLDKYLLPSDFENGNMYYLNSINSKNSLIMRVINQILLDKEVEFEESLFNTKVHGRVKEINMQRTTFFIYLYDDKKTYIYSNPYKPIKVYNSEETKIEKKLNILKKSNKFNL